MSYTTILSRIGYWDRAGIILSALFLIYAIVSIRHVSLVHQKTIASVATFGSLLFCTVNVWIDYIHVYMILGPVRMSDNFYRNQAWHDILFNLKLTLLITLPILILGWIFALKSKAGNTALPSTPLTSVKKKENSGDIY